MPVFIEHIKALDGAYLNLEGHAIRMDRTMRRFFRKGFVHPTLPRLLPPPPPQGLARLTLTYADSVLSTEFTSFEKPSISSLALVDAGPVDYFYKSQNRKRLARILEFSGADEAIVIRNGFVTNATTANLIFRDSSGGLFTPRHYIHSGTKRELYLRNKAIITLPIKPENLRSYETVYLVNAMLDIEDDVSLPCSEIRPVTIMPTPEAEG
jgi:4-amino-4-deoxychorismate lyase